MTDLLSGVELPRTFILYRKVDESGVSGTGVVAWGVEFPDGKCAIRWNTDLASTAIYDDMETLEKIHGHGGSTIILWNDVNDRS